MTLRPPILLGALASLLAAQEGDDRLRALQELRTLLTTPVEVATGTPTPFREAPASVTVITAEDLEAMGAESLDEALAMVPGLHVSASGALGAPRYFFRGVVSFFNPQALLVIDGVPLVSVVRGDRVGLVGTRLPVSAIARIEVIRGPGSALYGEEAFAGVILVHTRVAEGLAGTRVGLGAGSFASRGAWLNHGGTYGGYQVALTASAAETEGSDRRLEADAQTGFDQLGAALGAPPASRAPGPQAYGGRSGDLALAVGRGGWRLDLAQETREDMGTGPGGAMALDPQGRLASHRSRAALRYTPADLPEGWEAQAVATYGRQTQEIQRNLQLLPPGAFFGAFPAGFIGSPGYLEAQRGLEAHAVYGGWTAHRVRAGLGVDRREVLSIRETKNFDATFAPLPGGVQDVSNTPADWMPLRHRTILHAFAQDEWGLGTWTLTTGLRFDRFSDIGASTNPRLAMVGPLAEGWTLKLLHGQAFRAPAFVELWGRNNPVSLGNPDLRPERLSTTEAALGWQATDALLVECGLYVTRIRDFINFEPDPAGTRTARNADRLKGQGGELSLVYAPSSTFRLTAHGSYQELRDAATDRPLGEAPRTEAYLRLDHRFRPAWQADLQATWVGVRPRADGDPRAPLGGYATLDAILRRERLFGAWEVRLAVRNLLDRDVREPSQGPSAGAAFVDIPRDLPQPGRTVSVELAWRSR